MAKTGLNYGIYKALSHSDTGTTQVQHRFMSILQMSSLWQSVNLL